MGFGSGAAKMIKQPDGITTSRYTWFSFLFLNLFEQFHRVQNVYFLIIAILSMTKLSPIPAWVAVVPLLFVLATNAIKEGVEDARRHRSDHRENNQPVDVLDASAGDFVRRKWLDLRVGDILRVRVGEMVPADMLLLACADPTGTASVETSNLDGESNLKRKHSVAETFQKVKSIDDLIALKGTIETEMPDDHLYQFEATLQLPEHKPIPVFIDNLLWRGCQLRNPEEVYGLVVTTGHETKIMQNLGSAVAKRSDVELELNKHMAMIFLLDFLLCSVYTAASVRWEGGVGAASWYLGTGAATAQQNTLVFLTFVILFGVIVPISLFVTIEMARVIQGYFMARDLEMYDEGNDLPALARTTNLNEELGQVEYVFTDKTGTLTENEMVLRQTSIAGRRYQLTKEIQADGLIGDRNELVANIKAGSNAQLNEFMTCLAVSNTVDPQLKRRAGRFTLTKSKRELVPQQAGSDGELDLSHLQSLQTKRKGGSTRRGAPSKGGKGGKGSKGSRAASKGSRRGSTRGSKGSRRRRRESVAAPGLKDVAFNSDNPDEACLVAEAAKLGYFFHTRDTEGMIVEVNGANRHFDVLHVLHFTSDRKRMSVIVRRGDGRVVMYTKGADNIILSRVAATDAAHAPYIAQTQEHLDQMARTGLRTLAVAYRILPDSVYQAWSKRFKEAELTLHDREAEMDAVADEIERDLTLLGCTGVEDRLQDGVPETLRLLQHANIKVWVLTGDKKETAVAIAQTCNMLADADTKIVFESSHREAFATQLNKYVDGGELEGVFSEPNRRCTMVIFGFTLNFLADKELRPKLLKVATQCHSVVCYRCTPLQKALVVKSMRSYGGKRITLAIGDGANDVTMIQQAHIGVGIQGKEGRQAVNSSDYAIGRFRFLGKLLLVHGHWCYYRFSMLIPFSFYKNMTPALCLAFYVMFSAYSGQIFIDPGQTLFYNIFFTAGPIFAIANWDQDASAEALLRYPILYRSGQDRLLYNGRVMLRWIGLAACHALVCFMCVLAALTTSPSAADGRDPDIYLIGHATFSSIMITVTLMSGLFTVRWTVINWFFFLASFFNWAAYSFVTDDIPQYGPAYWVYRRAVQVPAFTFTVLLNVGICCLIGLAFRFNSRQWSPRPVHIVQELMQQARLRQRDASRPLLMNGNSSPRKS